MCPGLTGHIESAKLENKRRGGAALSDFKKEGTLRSAIVLCWGALAIAVFTGPMLSAAPIHDAVRTGDTAKVRALLQADGTRAMTRDTQGLTPLRIAMGTGNADVCAALLTGSPHTCYDQFLDSRTADGKEAQAAGELDRARDILVRLVREDPASPEINFAYGIVCGSLADHSFARMAFDRVLIARPDHARAHVALARSHLALGQPDLAAASFHRALAYPMPEAARKLVENYLGQAEGLARPRRFSVAGLFSVGYFRDDNVNVGPDAMTVRIAPLRIFGITFSKLAVGPDMRPIDDTGILVSGMLSTIFDIGEKSGWGILAETHYYQNWLDDTPERENAFYQAALGLQHRGPRSTLTLPLGADRILIDGNTFADRYAFSPSLLYATGAGANTRWLTRLRAEHRDYADSTARHGEYIAVSETLRRYLGTRRHSVFSTLSLLYDDTESGAFQNWGGGFGIGGELRLPWRVTTYVSTGYEYSQYEEREPLAPEDRVDELFYASVGINKRLSYGLSVDLGHRLLDNQSTFDLYEYQRNVTTLTASWAF